MGIWRKDITYVLIPLQGILGEIVLFCILLEVLD